MNKKKYTSQPKITVDRLKDVMSWDIIPLTLEESILCSGFDQLLCVWYNIDRNIKKGLNYISIATCEQWNNALDISNSAYSKVYTEDLRDLSPEILNTYFVLIGEELFNSWTKDEKFLLFDKFDHPFVVII